MICNIAESVEYNSVIECDILYLFLNQEYKFCVLLFKYRLVINNSFNI